MKRKRVAIVIPEGLSGHGGIVRVTAYLTRHIQAHIPDIETHVYRSRYSDNAVLKHLTAPFALAAFAVRCAAGRIDEPYQLFALGIPAVPALVEPIRAGLDRVELAVAPVSSGTTAPNFLHAGGDVDRCWPADVRARLRAIKADADPLGTIRSNRPVLHTH